MATSDLSNKRVLVLGLGTSGIAACQLCADRGARVTGVDRRPIAELDPAAAQLDSQGVRILTENDRIEESFDFMVCSPGVPRTHPMVERFMDLEIPIYAEIELASWFCPGTIVAITGTDGKSTTVSLIYQMLKDQGRSVRLVGNIGYAFSRMLLEQPPDEKTYSVVEVSSYQLELIKSFRPHVAAILNIAPDHLGRHGSIRKYAQAKYRITLNQTGEDYFVRPLSLPGSFSSRAQTLFWAAEPHELAGLHLDPRTGKLTTCFRGERQTFFISDLAGLMPHRMENILAALTVVMPLGLDLMQAIQSALAFPGLPHRLEYLGKWSGVHYYNDSKATNVHACQAALSGLIGPIILLAGGQAKDEDFRQLIPFMKGRVKLAILFGAARDTLRAAWEEAVPLVCVPTLEQATRLAIDQAEPGDTILLSPACASFDRFQNFEQRGNFFKSLVAEWVIEKKS